MGNFVSSRSKIKIVYIYEIYSSYNCFRYNYASVLFLCKEFEAYASVPRHLYEKDTWGISHDGETGFVKGIYGKGNIIFSSIKNSINKYLNNSVGSVIDYNLLKDAVDRHCETVEEDISTQTPVPLYCGLAGTMLGVIIGLGSLLFTDSITSLMTNSAAQQSAFYSAADGVSDLLTGVAWAMVASICGIGLTTLNSLQFKKCKLQEESGKMNS